MCVFPKDYGRGVGTQTLVVDHFLCVFPKAPPLSSNFIKCNFFFS